MGRGRAAAGETAIDEANAATGSSQRQAVYAVQAEHGFAQARYDDIAVEEPLEIRVAAAWQDRDETAPSRPTTGDDRQERTLSLTLRTPSSDDTAEARGDRELALGFLFAEGLISCRGDIESIATPERNVVIARFPASRPLPWRSLERHGVTSSACGLCGMRSLDALLSFGLAPRPSRSPPPRPAVLPTLIDGLPAKLRDAQAVFSRTGGLHAAALFDWQGQLLSLREDIGRHNAVDKLIGAALLDQTDAHIPLTLPAHILVVSGRAGFELVQKAQRASLSLFVAVGAPSSLAVSLAKEAGLTLVGFCRDGRFNVYSAPERIQLSPPPSAI